jgi:hypothetical protein
MERQQIVRAASNSPALPGVALPLQENLFTQVSGAQPQSPSATYSNSSGEGSRAGIHPSTFGPAYSPALDGERIAKQHEVIRDFMLLSGWKTLAEIEQALGYPQASVSAQSPPSPQTKIRQLSSREAPQIRFPMGVRSYERNDQMIPASIQIEQTLERRDGRKRIESPRCEREVEVWGYDKGRYEGICNAPNAEFNEKFEMFLCDCCAEEMELL